MNESIKNVVPFHEGNHIGKDIVSLLTTNFWIHRNWILQNSICVYQTTCK